MSNLKTRKDGRLVKTITDPRTHKRIFFYGKTEAELNKKILMYSQKAETGRTFIEVSEEWWEEAEPHLAIQSARSYDLARRRADEEFQDISVTEISPKNIANFLKKLAKKGYSRKTISNQRLILNLIFNHAVMEDYININPCTSVNIPQGLPKGKRTAASKADEQIIRELHDEWIFPYIAIMTGMRKGEILALQWKDVDFENNLIHVTKSVAHDNNIPIVKAPKTERGNRIIPLLLPLKERLLEIEDRNPEHFIVSDDGTKPLSGTRFSTLSKQFKNRTGTSCTAHELRHSFATISFESGVPLKSVQEILGHKQLSTTMDIYTDFRMESLYAAADLLNKKVK